jgi:putative polyhydroxyalkanoate system protein
MAQSIADDIRRDYGVRSSWKGNTLHFDGAGARGSLQLAAKELVLEVQLGLMLFALRDTIAARIERIFDEQLGKHKPKRAKSRSS